MDKLILYIMFIIVLAGNGMTQSPYRSAGNASNVFLRSGLSTRAAALSGAFTAISNDENALYFNPAGLVNVRMGAVALNHAEWFEDVRMDNILFGYNFDRRFGVGLSVAHLWMEPIQGKDDFGQPTENIDVSSSVLNLGFGYKVHPSFYTGVSIKYFRDDLGDYEADGVAVDLGFYMYTLIRGLTFGAVVQNIGGGVQYDIREEKIPLSYRAGLAYKPFGVPIHFALDAVKSVDADFRFILGLEYTYAEMFTLRAGNRFQPQEMLEPSFGAGLKLQRQYLFDYTFYQHSNLGATHRIGFTFRFNIPATRLVKEYASITKTPVRLTPPRYLTYESQNDKIALKWPKVYGSRYNVYARTNKKESWKKLNNTPLYSNQLKFNKPKHKGSYFIVVTSVIDGEESDYSNEVEIDVH